MHTFKTAKGTELPMLNLKGKDYLQVAHRLIWFREEHPDWGIETEVLAHSDKGALARATVRDKEGRVIATGHKTETAAGFPDFIEKSETGAIGRALALCGYGTQFAPDLDEGERIVDSPIEKVRPINTPHSKAAAALTPAPVNPGTVLVPFGRNENKPIFQVPVHELEADLAYWETRLKKEGKPPGKKVSEYLAAVNAYLDSKSVKPAHMGMIPQVDLPPMPSGPTYPVDEDVPF